MSRRPALIAVLLAAFAFAARPIGPRAFDGGANALTFEDRNGVALGTVLARDTEHAVRVPLRQVSPRFVAAIVATEDARFAHHLGVDPVAFGRAAWQLARTGHVVSGGSTITMQLARLRYDLPRTLVGKIGEMVLAQRIEAGTSKDAILEAYVNRLPMGGDLTGVEAGARTYFGTPASELDLAHAALLAALPNDPVRLDPYAHRGALEGRRRDVLARMVATGAVTAEEAARAASERVDVLPRSEGIAAAPHLLFRLAGGVAPDATRVRTTIDRDLQAFVENATQQVVGDLSERRARDGAAIVLDNRDGSILAYVGSADYFARAGAGKNDGVVALRQPGSTLKPFLYELAFERRVVRPDDDPRGRAGDVRPAELARVQPRRLQRPLRRAGTRAHRAGGLAQRARGARAQRRRRGELSRAAARARVPASDERSGSLRAGARARRRRGDARRARGRIRDDRERRAAGARARARRGGRARRTAHGSAKRRNGRWSPTCSPTRTRERARSASRRCCARRFRAR